MAVAEHNVNEVMMWLHSVEYDKPVRMAGLITEQYFSQKLKAAVASGRFKSIAEGWFYTAHTEVRHWYRLARPHEPLSEVELIFIKTFQPIGHRFFFLYSNIQQSNIGVVPRPKITVSVMELRDPHKNLNPVNSAHCDKLEKQINSEIETYLSGVDFDPKNGWNTTLPFSKWLLNVDRRSLELLFTQRCLMNSSIKSKPLDLDAMALSSKGNGLVFLEFKRKYPTKGSSRPIATHSNSFDFIGVANEIQSALNSAAQNNSNQARNRFDVECQSRELNYVNMPGFGLDMQHWETMALCDRMKIEYCYVIWNAGQQKSKGTRSLVDTLKELENLLTPEIRPVNKPNWWVRKLLPSDVRGLSFTSGGDSGSYSKKIRLQAIFDI